MDIKCDDSRTCDNRVTHLGVISQASMLLQVHALEGHMLDEEEDDDDDDEDD